MPNPLYHIRIPEEGVLLLHQARMKARSKGKTLGEWLTEKLPGMLMEESTPQERDLTQMRFGQLISLLTLAERASDTRLVCAVAWEIASRVDNLRQPISRE